MKDENNTNQEDIQLSQEEVWDILKYADGLSGGAIYPSILTPMLINERMKDVSLNNQQATEESIAAAMKNIKNSEEDLQAFSQDFEIQSQVYKKLLSYLGTMLSFDLTYTCTNASFSDYKSRAYEKDISKVKDFFDKFDYKKEFGIIVREMLRNETFFGCPRFDGKKLVIQELPSSPTYTKITGRWDYGMAFSFNFYWFLLPGVDINMYPKFFKDKYNELWGKGKDGGMQKYQPSLPPAMRGNSSWVYWQDIPPDVGWVWKMSPEIATRVPYFSGLFLDLIQQPLLRSLQKNINMTAASRIIIGQVGMIKDAGSKLKDQFNINPDLLGKFLGLVKSSIGDYLKVAAAPLENMQAMTFPAENNLYNSYLKTALATSGVNTNLIFTSDIKPNSIESQLSLNVDEQMMYTLYPQFEEFLNYYVNKNTSKFKFKFKFEGTDFFNNRNKRLEDQLKLTTVGFMMPQKFAAAIGMDPFEFSRQIEEAKANGSFDFLMPIVENKNNPNSTSNVGRPRKSEGELSDDGSDTRDSGANIEKGGKI